MQKLGKILAVLICLGAVQAAAQIQVTVLSAEDAKPVSGAHLAADGKIWNTDEQGVVYAPLKVGSKVRVSHLSFRDTIFTVGSKQRQTLYLFPATNILAGVNVSDKPYAVFAPEEEHVFDFCFRGDTLLVLTYEKERMMRKASQQSDELYTGCALVVIAPSGNILKRLPLPDYVTGFHKDFGQRTFILGNKFCKLVQVQKGKVSLWEVNLLDFEEKVLPVSARLNGSYYYDDYRWHYPEFSYFKYDTLTKQKARIRTISDAFTMELFRASYRHLQNHEKLRAWRMEKKTGIDKEVHAAYMSGFQNSPFYQELYAPLFVSRDTVYIFDHHNDRLFKHNENGSGIDSIEISYHRKSDVKFADKIATDTNQKSFWAVYKKTGKTILKAIDLQNGSTGKTHSLYHLYPENIRLHNGEVYYTYRKTGGEKTRHLFRERID